MTPPTPGTLRLKVLDVGEGDSIVILLPDSRRALVVDVFLGDRVLQALEDEEVEEVVLFLSHSDRDHVLGAQYLLSNFTGNFIGFFYNRDRLKATIRSEYVSLIRTLGKATRTMPDPFSGEFNINLNDMARFQMLVSAPVSVEVLHPAHSDQSSLLGTSVNDPAGVLRVVYTDNKDRSWAILLAADVQLTGISCLMDRFKADPSKLRADVLKFPHHGAWPSEYDAIDQFPAMTRRSIPEFLQAVNPRYVILSVGLDNPHEHVKPEVFDSLSDLTPTGRLQRILCTQFTGTCLQAGERCAPAKCAGDVEVRIGDEVPGGLEVFPSQSTHRDRIMAVSERSRIGCRKVLPLLSLPPWAPPSEPIESHREAAAGSDSPPQPP